jgi:hypothetical protein
MRPPVDNLNPIAVFRERARIDRAGEPGADDFRIGFEPLPFSTPPSLAARSVSLLVPYDIQTTR